MSAEIAVVYTSRVATIHGHAEVAETLTQTFDGPRAQARALQFLAATGNDFPEADGWHSFVWANEAARDVWAEEFMANLWAPAAQGGESRG